MLKSRIIVLNVWGNSIIWLHSFGGSLWVIVSSFYVSCPFFFYPRDENSLLKAPLFLILLAWHIVILCTNSAPLESECHYLAIEFSLTHLVWSGLNCLILCMLTAKASQEGRKESFYQEVNKIIVVKQWYMPSKKFGSWKIMFLDYWFILAFGCVSNLSFNL